MHLAANNGHVHAQRTLALMYVRGLGVPPDRQEALKWFRKAAQQGDSQAQAVLQKLADVAAGPVTANRE